MIFTSFGCRFRVSIYGGLDLWVDDDSTDYKPEPRWIRFGWDAFGIEPGEWSPEWR